MWTYVWKPLSAYHISQSVYLLSHFLVLLPQVGLPGQCWTGAVWENSLPCPSGELRGQASSFPSLSTLEEVCFQMFFIKLRMFPLFQVCWEFLLWIGVEIHPMPNLYQLYDPMTFLSYITDTVDYITSSQSWISIK